MRFHIEDVEVFFPYEYIYKEQYSYMVELKHALDAKGDALLEMPTGTGKTVTILSLITSYQFAKPDTGKLIYCTRTVPEMTKAMEELKRVIGYRRSCIARDDEQRARQAGAAAAPAPAAGDWSSCGPGGKGFLGLCLSARRNMCVNEQVLSSGEREQVDAGCRKMTAQWVRQQAAESGSTSHLCDYYEGYDRDGTEASISGIFNLDDIKSLGREKGWCPYFLARHAISFADVVVYNYQYMLDPKIASRISRELEDKSIVVFDEAHNIDNVCIEALSVTLDKRALAASAANVGRLQEEVARVKQSDAHRLQDEYDRLLRGLSAGGALGERQAEGAAAATGGGAAAGGGGGAGGGEELLAAAALPSDVLEEAVPGQIRNAERFLRFMRHVIRWLRQRINRAQVETETPTAFLHNMESTLEIDSKPLKFAYSRLNSLMRTLEITNVDEFEPLGLVADFCTLLATYPVGFMVILEPFNSLTPAIPDPVLQLACLDASLAIRPVFQKFRSVVLTSGTLSPLDMYPKILNFQPRIRASFEMSITRPCICPMIVSKGADQSPLTTRFEERGNPKVVANYGALLLTLCSTVPDGIIVFFPSYAYMESIVAAWHESRLLEQISKRKLLFIERKDIVATTLSLANYKRACDTGRGAIYFSVARGKVAEGIDFDRHYGRAVVLIGIPYQYTLSHVLRARLAFMRDNFHIKEQDFLTFDALRQSAQCIGRVIRSKNDYGLMVLGDSRYAKQDKRSKLPQWVLQFLPEHHINLSCDMSGHIARRFLKDIAQPQPAGAAIGKSLLSRAHVRAIEEQASRAHHAGVEASRAAPQPQPQPQPPQHVPAPGAPPVVGAQVASAAAAADPAAPGASGTSALDDWWEAVGQGMEGFAD